MQSKFELSYGRIICQNVIEYPFFILSVADGLFVLLDTSFVNNVLIEEKILIDFFG